MKNQVVRLLTLALLPFISGSLHAQTPTVLYNFAGNATDPVDFFAPGTLAQGLDGGIYTTSVSGGNPPVDYPDDGTVFGMSTGGSLSELITFTFDSSGLFSYGAGPYSGVTLGTDGNFYGATLGGGVIAGADADGTLFRIDSNGNLTTLYTFTGGSDGGEPQAGPIEGTDGNFYGTTVCGGSQACQQGGGTLYQLTPARVLTTLHQFDCAVGCNSDAPLVQGTDGNFYGSTFANMGTVFKITSSGTFTTLHQFDVYGQSPAGALIEGSNGNFYGTTQTGGVNGVGVVFKMTAAGKVTVLHNFVRNGIDGIEPLDGLVQAPDGNLYGVTTQGGTFDDGTIFVIDPTGKGYSVLYSFDGTTGMYPQVALLQHTTGLLYGLTAQGGTNSYGTFYSFNVGLKPFVSLVSPSGAAGSTIGILGQGFTDTKKVMFTGGVGAFTVINDTYLVATVPGTAKTGFVTVKTPGGTLKSNKKFYVTP